MLGVRHLLRSGYLEEGEAAMNAQRKALDKLVDDVVGSNADEATKKAVRGMAMGMYNENLQSNFYPENHPRWIAQREAGVLPAAGLGLQILANGVRAALA